MPSFLHIALAETKFLFIRRPLCAHFLVTVPNLDNQSIPSTPANESQQASHDDGAHAGSQRNAQADSFQHHLASEPLDRTKADILMFVIIAVGTAILVCLIVPAVIYVIKHKKAKMKSKISRRIQKSEKTAISDKKAKRDGNIPKIEESK
ncbi:hypothetical protein Y032_0102g3454 [Ancylostoma ceylanicum]|nr:hypothetical protein Y032_0102g3454 [Ancylostoma ceylanicum]